MGTYAVEHAIQVYSTDISVFLLKLINKIIYIIKLLFCFILLKHERNQFL